jgi:hypothetical protein
MNNKYLTGGKDYEFKQDKEDNEVKVLWHQISKEGTPIEFGWYLAAMNPKNYEVLHNLENLNPWRESCGTQLVLFNDSKFWIHITNSALSEDVTDRVTHWAYLPVAPLYWKKG